MLANKKVERRRKKNTESFQSKINMKLSFSLIIHGNILRYNILLLYVYTPRQSYSKLSKDSLTWKEKKN